MAKELKPGEVLLRVADFPADIGDGLESDLVVEEGAFDPDRLWCVAIANKSRLKKAVSEQFRLKLEELTGREWRTDGISKFVFHLITADCTEKNNKSQCKSVKSVVKKGRCKVGKSKSEVGSQKSEESEKNRQQADQDRCGAPVPSGTKGQTNGSVGPSGGPLEVVFNREALLGALKLASLAAAKSSPKPILKHVLMTAAGSDCRIRATDLDVALEVKVPCRAEKTGTVCLPCKELTEAVARSDDDEVTIRRSDRYIELITGDGRYQFNIMDVGLFPDSAFGLEVQNVCEFKLAELQAATGKVLCAVSKEATRYALNGMLWECVAGGLNLVATDGRRLAKVCIKMDNKCSMNRKVLSRRTARLLAHLEAQDDTVCRVEFTESNIFLVTDTIYMAGLLIEGEFPKYSDIIPVGAKHSIELDAAAVARQVQRAKIFEGEDENVRNVIISSENGTLVFDAENVGVGKAEMRLAVAHNEAGDNADPVQCGALAFEIAVRSKYLLEALKTFISAADGRGKFRLEVNDSDQPLVLADDDTLHVIMPVKV